MSDASRHRRAKEIFLEACQRRLDEQEAYLANACGHDAVLRAQVDAMLAADRDRPQFLEDSPAKQFPHGISEPTTAPDRIGSFRIVRLIGEGGMGQVFEAEQDNPRRRVALKVLRPGLALPALKKRFEVEKSLLARLQHPGIAQIFEAGTADVHDSTQPYFAMEFVDGVDLMSFARSGGHSVRERLELFVRICDAVHHAHQKGVIHRDLKPANIVVGADGQPKVLDFGIARAVDSDVQLTTIGTDRAQIMGTLPYMSPEQAAAAPEGVDLRSDVYALGVVLYELLSDRLPYDVSDIALPEAVRVICEQEPQRISRIHRGLRGDLETIAQKSLEKDKQRRYVSADALAADVRRYLRDEAIQARPASRVYKLAKFARRNKLLVGALAALFVALVAGLWSSLHFGLSEAEQRRDSERQAYYVSIRSAGYEIEADRLAAAQRSLDGATAELRDWEWHYLRARLDRAAQILTGPEAPIWYAGFVRGTPLVLGVDAESVAHLWDRTTQERVTVRLAKQPHEIAVSKRVPMAVRADGAQVLTKMTVHEPGRASQTVAVLWETTTGRVRQRFAVAGLVSDNAGASAISPTGAHVALGADPSSLHLYEVESAKLLEVLPYYGRACAFATNGEWLAHAFGTDVRFWHVEANERARGDINAAPSRKESDILQELALSPDGSLLATCTANTIQVWDLVSDKRLHTQLGPAGRVYNLGFSDDGSRLVAHGDAFRVFEPRSGRLLRQLPGHGEHSDARFGFDAAGATLAVGSLRGREDGIRLFALEDEVRATLVLSGHAGQVERVAIRPDGRVIASASRDGEVRLWDAETSHLVTVLHGTEFAKSLWGSAANIPGGLAFDPSAERLVLASGSVNVWDTATGAHSRRADEADACAFSPDGSLLLLARDDGLDVCDGRTFERQTRLRLRCSTIDFSADGEFFATACGDDGATGISVFRTRTLEKELVIDTEAPVVSLSFSPGGTWIAGGDAQGDLTVFDATGRPLVPKSAHRGAVCAVRFLSERRLASGGEDGFIRIWDVSDDEDTPQLVLELGGQGGSVLSLAFSPHDERLVSASADGNVRIWETQPITHRLDAHRAALAMRSKAQRLVCKLLAEEAQTNNVVEKLRSETSLDEALRQEALHAVLRHRELEYTGLVPGTAQAARARPDNKVLELDGKSAVSVDFRRALDDLRTFTLECWVRGETPKSCGALLSNYKKSGFAIYARGHTGAIESTFPWGMVNLETSGFRYVGTRTTWQWNKWTHVAICYDDETLTLFVDGQPIDNMKSSGPIDRSELPFFVGAGPGEMGSRHFFTGLIDEVRLSRVARYRDAFQPATVHETDDDTLLLLHFDAEVRGFYPDDSGKRHHAWPIAKPRLVRSERR